MFSEDEEGDGDQDQDISEDEQDGEQSLSSAKKNSNLGKRTATGDANQLIKKAMAEDNSEQIIDDNDEYAEDQSNHKRNKL